MELLGYMRSGNPVVMNDTKAFFADLVKMADMTGAPRCERMFKQKPDENVYALFACIVHQQPSGWWPAIKEKSSSLENLLYKIRFASL